MNKTEIILSSIQDVRDFVNIVILVDYDVDLAQGRYIIDAKSIMGIFSLDLMKPIGIIGNRIYFKSRTTPGIRYYFEFSWKYIKSILTKKIYIGIVW